jgi:hypothetical protein
VWRRAAHSNFATRFARASEFERLANVRRFRALRGGSALAP